MLLQNRKIKKKYKTLFNEEFGIPCKLREIKESITFIEEKRKPIYLTLVFSTIQLISSIFFLIQYLRLSIQIPISTDESIPPTYEINISNIFYLILAIVLLCSCTVTFVFYIKLKKKKG